jgi:hypothetical protein
LIEAFKPKDIWPCTVDKANWSAAQSMSFLFGHLYEMPCKFTHDQEMFRKTGGAVAVVPESGSGTPENHVKRHAGMDESTKGNRSTSNSERAHASLTHSFLRGQDGARNAATSDTGSSQLMALPQEDTRGNVSSTITVVNETTRKRRRSDDHATKSRTPPTASADGETGDFTACPSSGTRVMPEATHTTPSTLTTDEYSEAWKQQAFEAALGTSSTDWNDITLVSVSGHQEREQEL